MKKTRHKMRKKKSLKTVEDTHVHHVIMCIVFDQRHCLKYTKYTLVAMVFEGIIALFDKNQQFCRYINSQLLTTSVASAVNFKKYGNVIYFVAVSSAR